VRQARLNQSGWFQFFLQGAVFDDRAVKAMTMAYDAALIDLGLLNRTERLNQWI